MLLAEAVAEQLGFPCVMLANKIKHTTAQVKLDKTQRANNLLGAFRATQDKQVHTIEHIIIVDDVTTTGSTLNVLAGEIKKTYPDAKVW